MSGTLILDRLSCPSSPCRALLPVNGEKNAVGLEGSCFATSAIGEIIDYSAPLPVYGERMAVSEPGTWVTD
jgi:hypothetical protein